MQGYWYYSSFETYPTTGKVFQMKLCPLIHKNRGGSKVRILADVNARFGSHVQISDGTGVEAHFGAVIGNDVKIGPNVKVLGGATVGDGAILCDGVEVGWRAEVGQEAYLGHNVKLGPRSSVGPYVVIPDNTVIPAGHNVYRQANILIGV